MSQGLARVEPESAGISLWEPGPRRDGAAPEPAGTAIGIVRESGTFTPGPNDAGASLPVLEGLGSCDVSKPFARFSFAWLNERELPEAVRRMAAAQP